MRGIITRFYSALVTVSMYLRSTHPGLYAFAALCGSVHTHRGASPSFPIATLACSTESCGVGLDDLFVFGAICHGVCVLRQIWISSSTFGAPENFSDIHTIHEAIVASTTRRVRVAGYFPVRAIRVNVYK